MILSLRTWLALGLVLAIAVPGAAAAGAWLAAGAWQTRRESDRQAAALAAIESTAFDTAAGRRALAGRLSALGVEADLEPAMARKELAPDATKAAIIAASVRTPGLDAIVQGTDGKLRLTRDYTISPVELPQAGGQIYVRHEGAAARWAIAAGAAAITLAAVLALAVSLLARWVLRPLARLAADAERIAGGELAVAPVATRAREVAQVGGALGGMAGALDAALGASAAAERERRFLVTAMAHDLRTPLFTLRGSLEAIEHGIGDDGALLARAQAKASHLDRLVGDLFTFSRAEYAREGLRSEPADLAEIARRAADTVDPGELELDVETNGPVPLHGDPVALQRVLTNLLDNALRHAHTRVELRVRGRSVEVADDGPGFAPEDLPHVFDPLFRGDRSRATRTGGAGLGLAIARRLVRAQGGEVEAANRADGGARVTVRL